MPTLQLPANFGASLAETASAQISSFSSYILLILGIMVVLIVLENIIGSLRGHK